MLEINLLRWRQLAQTKKRRQQVFFSGIVALVFLMLVSIYSVVQHRATETSMMMPSQNAVDDAQVSALQELQQLKLIGYLHDQQHTWALLRLTNAKTVDVQVGSVVGKRGAKVSHIDAHQIVFSLPNKQVFSLSLSIV